MFVSRRRISVWARTNNWGNWGNWGNYIIEPIGVFSYSSVPAETKSFKRKMEKIKTLMKENPDCVEEYENILNERSDKSEEEKELDYLEEMSIRHSRHHD